MRPTNLKTIVLALTLASPALAAPGFGGSSATGRATQGGKRVEAIRIQYRVNPDTAERAEALADGIADGTISKMETRKPVNAKLFLHLAAGARDPKVVSMALQGMGRTWSRDGRGDRPKVDKDYMAVVSGRLGDKNPQVRAGALAAARLIIGGQKTNDKMLNRVIKMATAKGAADRVAAMQALFNVRDFQIAKSWPGDRKARIVAAHLSNLDDKEAHVVAVALKNLGRAAYPGLPEKAKLQAKARGLLAHAEPAVRAGALQLLAGLASSAELNKSDGALLLAGLADKHAHVRAAAAMAIAKAEYLAGVHALIERLDDGADSKLKIEGFTGLDGKKGKIPLPTHASRVDETVLESLRQMTAKSKMKFEFESLGFKERAANRAKTIAAAKAWYAKNKGKLPAAPAAAAAAPEAPKAEAKP